MKKVVYSEPTDYIPKDIRKKNGLGEYNKDEEKNEKKKRSKENEEFRRIANGK